MEQGRDGLVSSATIISQLLYEIQGILYFNSDVTADIEYIKVEDINKNQVRVTGVKGLAFLEACSATYSSVTDKN